MQDTKFLAMAVAVAALLPIHEATAHAIAGPRLFPVTLTMDDPGVADEASIPTFTYQRADGASGPIYQYHLNFEFDKRITENFGVGINWGWNINQVTNGKTAGGFQNLFFHREISDIRQPRTRIHPVAGRDP